MPSPAQRIHFLTNTSNLNLFLIGVHDGLLTKYVTRISSLRSEAGPSSTPKYDIINKALEIWDDLFRWKPKVTIGKDHELISQFYQWALWIWLFSIVYPDGKSDPKVQSDVEWMAAEMTEITSVEMACLLFPLFVVGSAAIRIEERDVVTKHFKRIRPSSNLGNVDLTFKVVKKLWEGNDAGVFTNLGLGNSVGEVWDELARDVSSLYNVTTTRLFLEWIVRETGYIYSLESMRTLIMAV